MNKRIILLLTLLLGELICQSQVVIKNQVTASFGESGFFKRPSNVREIRLQYSDILRLNGNKKAKSGNGTLFTDHTVDTSIAIHKIASWKHFGTLSVARIKITIPQAPNLRLLFRKLSLPDNAEMYIYNDQRTTILGPITSHEKIHEGKLWGTNVFTGNSITIEVKVPTDKLASLQIQIKRIIFGFSEEEKKLLKADPADSLRKTYFNTSSPCNVNVLCSAGSGYDVERRGVALILTEDGGAASGFMVNDACNSMTPYFMTAFHVAATRDPGSWQYIFQYWSPQCSPNQDGSYSLLFNGGTLLALNDPTDFALIQLYTQPKAETGIAYLGWSRSTSAPTTSVGIHHPHGDVMKVSVENDAATVGNVATYSNTAWRVHFDVGLEEPGSSGSPLFDPNKLVVGQLYSGTQPNYPCNSPTGGTNYGRFDLSWTGGGTSNTRLKDYLDPGNSSPSSVLTFDPLNTVAINGVSSFCSGTETYTFGTLPSGMSLSSWSISPASGVAILGTSGSSATLSYYADGVVTLTATFNTLCSGTLNISRKIGVGGPAISFYIDPLWYTENHEYCANSFGNNFQIIGEPDNVTAFEWGISPSTVIDANGWLEEHGVYFGTGGYYQIYARAKNACGYGSSNTATLNIYVNDNCTGGLSTKSRVSSVTTELPVDFTISPNPARSLVRIRIPGIMQLDRTMLRLIESSGAQPAKVLRPAKYNVDVDVSRFPAGTYVVEISDGKRRYAKKVIVQ